MKSVIKDLRDNGICSVINPDDKINQDELFSYGKYGIFLFPGSPDELKEHLKSEYKWDKVDMSNYKFCEARIVLI